jgi:hypothetical protein
MMESYNIILGALQGLKLLQQSGYCKDQMVFLCEEDWRRGVAKLANVDIARIKELVLSYKESLDRMVAMLRSDRGSIDEMSLNSEGLTAQCRITVLDKTGWTMTSSTTNLPLDLWECVAQFLGLAVVSYAGAHIGDIGLHIEEPGISSLQVPTRIRYADLTLKSITPLNPPTKIYARRAHLQCLNSFLSGIPVLVFHTNQATSPTGSKLCLSGIIADITNLWGPSWKIVRDSRLGEIQQFEIGNGMILPWSQKDQAIPYRPSEIYSHWISSKSWNFQVVTNGQRYLSRDYFLDSDILLIGADVKT